MKYLFYGTTVSISITESQRGTGWNGPLRISQSNPPAKAGLPTAGCTGPCPHGFGVSPEKETPQPLVQPVPVLCHPESKEILPHVQMKLLMPHFVPAAPCPVAGHH